MEYIVVTSKNHDGFCLFKAEVDNNNVVDGTPFKRDIIGELANACAKHNLKLGLYYSQLIDWHEPHGGYGMKFYHTNNGMSRDNDWNFPDRSKKNCKICYENKIKPQVKEILTNYGDLCLVWFDTPLDIIPEYSKELCDMVKHYQPHCLVDSRIGNGMGDYHSMGNNQLPDEYAESLVEAPISLNHTWGYKSFDEDWKSADKVIEIREKSKKCGANLLLNVGPDGLGRFHVPAIDILHEVGTKIKK